MPFVPVKEAGGDERTIYINSDRVLYVLPVKLGLAAGSHLVLSGPPAEGLNLTVKGSPAQVASVLDGAAV